MGREIKKTEMWTDIDGTPHNSELLARWASVGSLVSSIDEQTPDAIPDSVHLNNLCNLLEDTLVHAKHCLAEMKRKEGR